MKKKKAKDGDEEIKKMCEEIMGKKIMLGKFKNPSTQKRDALNARD